LIWDKSQPGQKGLGSVRRQRGLKQSTLSRPSAEATSRAEVAVQRTLKNGESPATVDPQEAKHRPFPSSKRLIPILGAFDQPAA
jgi:hypothetical protein